MGERHAVAFQPLQVGDAVATEAPQRFVTDHALGFMPQVVEHRLGAVVETRRLLVPGTTAGVYHATTAGAGTAAGKAVGDQHIGTLGTRLQRCTSPGGAPADHQHIALRLPLQVRRVGHLQRFEDRGDCAVHATSRRLAARWLAAT